LNQDSTATSRCFEASLITIALGALVTVLERNATSFFRRRPPDSECWWPIVSVMPMVLRRHLPMDASENRRESGGKLQSAAGVELIAGEAFVVLAFAIQAMVGR